MSRRRPARHRGPPARPSVRVGPVTLSQDAYDAYRALATRLRCRSVSTVVRYGAERWILGCLEPGRKRQG
jgi:hypothetical protein